MEKELRVAQVRNADSAKQLWAYLPENYAVVASLTLESGQAGCAKTEYLIVGYDDAGWTMEDYVVPRLASGLLWATDWTQEPELVLEFLKAARS